MTIEKTLLPEVLLLIPKVHGDERGWFMENYSAKTFAELGIDSVFVQDNHSYSKEKGIIRGLHFQNNPMAQTKLLRCTRGKILDVVVDIRKGSPNYKKWTSFELSEENKIMAYIPKGFAHGFVTLSGDVEIQYKVDALYSPEHDRSIKWDDAEIGVEWCVSNPILSEKDKKAPLLCNSDCNFIY